MAFKNAAKTVTVSDKTFPDWAKGSSWTFRSEKHGGDDDAVEGATTRRIVGEIDQKAVRAALKKGDSIRNLIPVTEEQVMSTRNALLTQMSVSWTGPEFQLPADHPEVDEKLKPVKIAGGRTKRDPHAGDVPPCTEHYIRQQDGFLLSEVYEYLVAIWAGRSPEEDATFPERAVGVDEPGGDGRGSVAESEAAATGSVSGVAERPFRASSENRAERVPARHGDV